MAIFFKILETIFLSFLLRQGRSVSQSRDGSCCRGLSLNGDNQRGMSAPSLRVWQRLLTSNFGLPPLFSLSAEAFASSLPRLSPAPLAWKSTSSARHFSEPADTPELPAFSAAGRVTGSYTVSRQPVFAVVELGPTQLKVSPDDVVYTEKLKGVDVNDKISLNRVLLLGTQSKTVIGRPHLPKASVLACVEVWEYRSCSCIDIVQRTAHVSCLCVGAFPRC